tara:strand:- start:382197 stop:385121 length:2925 start_codon:yes stop_codon:yes gene_type:complete
MNRCLAAGCVWILLTYQAISDDSQSAKWIWRKTSTPQAVSDNQPVFRKTFSVAQATTQATIRCATLYTACDVEIDGRTIAKIEAFDPLATIDLTGRLGTGPHTITVQCQPCGGPSSFFLSLDVTLADGTKSSIVTNESWTTDGIVNALDDVSRKLIIPESRQVRISPVENYEQWKQALGDTDASDPATFQIADGFDIQLVRAAADDEDSWVSFAFDDQGRITVAKEQSGLLRMTLSADGTSVVKTETIDETLKECRGLLWREGVLFANANDSKALFRIERKSDGQLGRPVELFSTPGGLGHGRNDLRFGPDGMLYSIHGDSVDLPQHSTDRTSPFRAARRGQKTSEGHLVRIDPSSGETQLITAGLRNPFGIDFNPDGEAFTYDADAEYDMGASWYRPTRVNHLVVGGDYGWRGVTKSWPPYFCDRADAAHRNLDIGKGSPTAVRFGTHSNFPAHYRDALFVLDWAYGRVLAVNLVPRGASYLMAAETFLQGRPLNVTDIDFAPDGSMYLITGGRKTQSAIYRVVYNGQTFQSATANSAYRKACDAFAAESRSHRRGLETQLLEPPRRAQLDTIWQSLQDSDPWIQYAAANRLERFPVAWWKDRALQDNSTRALLSLARSLGSQAPARDSSSGDASLFDSILRKLNTISIAGKPRSQQLEIVQTYHLALASPRNVTVDTLQTTSDKLLAAYPSEYHIVNSRLSALLMSMGEPRATARTVQLLRAATEPTQRFHFLYVLRGATEGWSLADRRAYFQSLRQADRFLGGAGMPDFLSKIREEAIATLTTKEHAALADVLMPESSPSVANAPPREFVRQWTVDALMASIDTKRSPDLARGKMLFSAASCVRCHRIGDLGTLVGPDLTAASGRYRRRDLLAAIIEPSLVIAENYRSVQVLTEDGKTLTGQIVVGGDYRSPKLRLTVDPMKPFDVTEIDKTDIVSQKFSDVSWMPADLLNTLTVDEVQDLAAFIESGGHH